MENITGFNEMILKEKSVNDLNETRKWTLFLGILGMILLGLLFIFLFFINIFLSHINRYPGSPMPFMFPQLPFIIMMIIFIVVDFFPLFYLIQFSVFSKKAITLKNEYDIQMAFRYLKMYFKFLGILAIVIMSFYFLVIFIFVIARALI